MTKRFNVARSCGVTIIATGLMSAPVAADVKTGVDAWGRGDYQRAVAEWRPEALAGDPDAQFDMGQAYKLGRGVVADPVQAEEWYRQAAVQGHLQAQDNYALALFQNGKRLDAVPWLEKSAARGEPRAQLVLGTMLFNGDIIKKDWVRAYALVLRSSAAGLAQGSETLAEMDQYISAEVRQRGISLARELERDSDTHRSPPVVPPGKAPPALVSAPARSERPTASAPSAPAAKGGGWRIQVGAFKQAANATALWQTLHARVGSLALLQPSYLKVASLTRLQIGPIHASDVERVCADIKAKSPTTPCVPIAP
ncbi:MAG: SPOR domain-containing protein [Sphingomonas sp.]|nr:SPOR domain-containing protein [Sphingomonas sp.]